MFESIEDIGCSLYEFIDMLVELKETIDEVIKDIKFVIHYEEQGTGLFDTIQMMKQMVTMLEGVKEK